MQGLQVQGLTGDQGIQGIQGLKGDAGPSGISGYQVVVGDAGSSSTQGQDIAISGATCPAGKSVLGGGYSIDDSSFDSRATASGPEGSNEWVVGTASTSPTDNYAVTAYAICARVTS